MYTPREPEFRHDPEKNDLEKKIYPPRKGSGPLPPLEEMLGGQVFAVLDEQEGARFSERSQQFVRSIAERYVPKNQSKATWEMVIDHIIPDRARLEAVIKNHTGEKVLTTESLLYLLSSACTARYPESYDRCLLFACLQHPNATKEVYREVFSFAIDDFLRPKLLTEIFSFDCIYQNDVVKEFLTVMKQKFTTIPKSFEYHVSAWITLACVGEWREEDYISVELALEDYPHYRELFHKSTQKGVAYMREQVAPIEYGFDEHNDLTFTRDRIREYGVNIPKYFVQRVIEHQLYDEEIIASFDPMLLARVTFQLLEKNVLVDSARTQVWKLVFPRLLKQISIGDLLVTMKEYQVQLTLTEQEKSIVLTHPDIYRPLIGVLMVQAMEGADYTDVLDLFLVMYALTQHAGRESLCTYVWEKFHEPLCQEYCANTLSDSVRHSVQMYFYTHLFAAGCIRTFEELTELYDVLPESRDKTFHLLSLFIRSGADRSALDALDTYFAYPQWQGRFTEEERALLLTKIAELK